MLLEETCSSTCPPYALLVSRSEVVKVIELVAHRFVCNAGPGTELVEPESEVNPFEEGEVGVETACGFEVAAKDGGIVRHEA